MGKSIDELGLLDEPLPHGGESLSNLPRPRSVGRGRGKKQPKHQQDLQATAVASERRNASVVDQQPISAGESPSEHRLSADEKLRLLHEAISACLGEPHDHLSANADGKASTGAGTAALDAPRASYSFEHAFPPRHFVTQWIETFSKQCDAALEYHEAGALVALAEATPSLNARISGSADGLRTNLYVLFIGEPGITRKSTAKDYVVHALRRASPRVLLPEQMTQESLVENVALCQDGAALWAIDEFTDMLSKMLNSNYLAGMRGILLELYARTNYTYKRVSKGPKGDDGEREDDSFDICNVTFSIIGCATPTLFQDLDNTAVGSGLLTRFAIIMPESKPPRIPQYELKEEEAIPSALVKWLQGISAHTVGKTVTFASGVLQRLDEAIDKPLDESANRCLMTVRAGIMARKVAMLAAAGGVPEPSSAGQLIVTLDDAEAAIRVVTRWIQSARAFEARTEESSFEVKVQKCVALVKGRTVNRREIAKLVHVPAKVMNEIQETLVQRDQIEVEIHKPTTGRSSCIWKWVGEVMSVVLWLSLLSQVTEI